MPFALQIDPPTQAFSGSLSTRLLGLTLPLRLALTAQSSGATAIVTASPEVKALLADPRLRIPVTEQRPSGVFLISAPANLLVHRSHLQKGLAARGERDWPLLDEPEKLDVPFGFDPIVITGDDSLGPARKAMLRSLRKPQDGWTSNHLNRHISLFFTRFLVALPLHPNQVSVVILGIGMLGAYLASLGSYEMQVLGAFLFQMQSVLDGCDGEMSRLTFQGSTTGEWLDTVGDDLTNYGFFGAAAWGLYVTRQNPLYLWVGGVIVALGVIVSAIEYRYLIKIGSGDLNKYPLGVGKTKGEDEQKGLVDLISPLFKRDTFVFLTLVAAALGQLAVMLVIFAFGAVAIFVAVLKAELRMARERASQR